MSKNYEIKKTGPTVYLDETDNAVNGFKLTVYLPEHDETHFINVSSLDVGVVKAACEKLAADRHALADLGAE